MSDYLPRSHVRTVTLQTVTNADRFHTNFMAARSLPGIFSAGSGHYGGQGYKNEHQGTPLKPPIDRKHGDLQESSPRQLQEMQY
jgi:hypothetical protein